MGDWMADFSLAKQTDRYSLGDDGAAGGALRRRLPVRAWPPARFSCLMYCFVTFQVKSGAISRLQQTRFMWYVPPRPCHQGRNLLYRLLRKKSVLTGFLAS